jgi:hypothetical protein
LILEIVLELLSFLSALLASATTPAKEDDSQKEYSPEDDEQNLPPDKAMVSGWWLLRVGVEWWNSDWWATAWNLNQLGKADTKPRGRSGSTSTINSLA